MSLRDRLVNRVRKILGGESPVPTTQTAPDAVARQPVTPQPLATQPAAMPPVAGAASAQRATPPTTDAPPEDPAGQAAKVERARARARKGVLLHIEKEGGSVKMSDAHDYSERRFFIAHRGFSDMMGWWLEAEYIRYEEGMVYLTDSGRAFAHDG